MSSSRVSSPVESSSINYMPSLSLTNSDFVPSASVQKASLSFFSNRAAVIGTFVAVGLVLALLCTGFVLYFFYKRRNATSKPIRDLHISSPVLQDTDLDKEGIFWMSSPRSLQSTRPPSSCYSSRPSSKGDHIPGRHGLPSLPRQGVMTCSKGQSNVDDHFASLNIALGASNGLSSNGHQQRPVSSPVRSLAPLPSIRPIHHASETVSSPEVDFQTSIISEVSTRRLSSFTEPSYASDHYLLETSRVVNNLDSVWSIPSPTDSDESESRRRAGSVRAASPPIPPRSPLRPSSPPSQPGSPLLAALTQKTLLNVHDKRNE